jgi:lycopene cyclase domain-containing protein
MEYTLAAVVSAGTVLVLDRVLRTRVLGRTTFWIFLAVMAVCMTVANGYLKWRPVVLYGEGFFLGIRLGTIPVEDYLYGFSFITLSVVLWEFLRTRGSRPSDASTSPRKS